MRRILLVQAMLCLSALASFAQYETKTITGNVYESEHGHKHPIIGANIYWSGTSEGTVSNKSGNFSIDNKHGHKFLVVSFIGYTSDTVLIEEKKHFEVLLQDAIDLEEAEIVKRRKSTELSMINPLKIERISSGELEKAACCNLSESFETNPSVDVSFTDAITGTKQIQMLGLAGPYTQITRENIPAVRGLLSIYGMEHIPGPWIESIQLNKGTGSVVNGFESIAGQINVELRKPEESDKLYLNLFGNTESRTEANLSLAHQINDRWSTGLLMHGRKQFVAMDNNGDGFTDKPTGDQFIFLNRWKFKDEHGWVSQIGIKATGNNTLGGQTGYIPKIDEGLWGFDMETRGIEGWLKLGRVFEAKPSQSFGIQLSGLSFDQNSKFGFKEYSGLQQSLYGNFIFQSILSDTRHNYRLGGSFQYDEYTESLDSLNFIRKELVPGIFTEYTFSPAENIDVVAGIRADYHNQYKLFITPRLHMRYALTDNTVLRFSAGRGQRTASILSENSAVMASSRSINIQGDNSDKPYGLNPETAWNVGGNFTQKYKLDYRDGSISFDIYHTYFTDQVVYDLDASPQTILFYNLDGKSYSTSFQSQFDYELIRRLDVRLAYRWYDVKTQYQSGLKSKPLVASHRAFINLAYATRNHWKFDYTLQWYGSKRIPETGSNPEIYRLAENSPSFSQMNAQVSKEWQEKFELYLGVENLLDYKQENPILASDQPFGQYFDSSLVWGPIFGRMVYVGLRFKIK